MKVKSTVLYLSVALNVALLVFLVLPRSADNLAFANVASIVGNYAAVTARSSSSAEALWLANRATGKLVIYQHQSGFQDNPVEIADTIDLTVDLDERQVGNLMLVATDISSSTSAVFVIDTDSEKMAVYQYDKPNRTVKGIQRMDLRTTFGRTTDTSAPATY